MHCSGIPPDPHRRSVRLITEHVLLDTQVSERLSNAPLPWLYLTDTTLSLRTPPPLVALLTLPHCVIAKDQILKRDEQIHPPVATQPPDITHPYPPRRMVHPFPPSTTTSRPEPITPHDFLMRPLRLVTDALILDAHMAVHRTWTALSPREWIRRDSRALLSLTSVRLYRTARPIPRHQRVLLTLESCDLPRSAILHVTTCPSTSPESAHAPAHTHTR